jgi:hypothetical protein
MGRAPKLQTELRVTKFDPALRDARGAFTGDDWTSVATSAAGTAGDC